MTAVYTRALPMRHRTAKHFRARCHLKPSTAKPQILLSSPLLQRPREMKSRCPWSRSHQARNQMSYEDRSQHPEDSQIIFLLVFLKYICYLTELHSISIKKRIQPGVCRQTRRQGDSLDLTLGQLGSGHIPFSVLLLGRRLIRTAPIPISRV